MEKEKHKQQCDCIFCNSKCPECGSTDIEINFILECNFSNTFKDKISIDHNMVRVKLTCDGCDIIMIDSGEFSDWQVFCDVQTDDRLDRIRNALSKYYPLRKDLDYKDKEGLDVSDWIAE